MLAIKVSESKEYCIAMTDGAMAMVLTPVVNFKAMSVLLNSDIVCLIKFFILCKIDVPLSKILLRYQLWNG